MGGPSARMWVRNPPQALVCPCQGLPGSLVLLLPLQFPRVWAPSQQVPKLSPSSHTPSLLPLQWQLLWLFHSKRAAGLQLHHEVGGPSLLSGAGGAPWPVWRVECPWHGTGSPQMHPDLPESFSAAPPCCSFTSVTGFECQGAGEPLWATCPKSHLQWERVPFPGIAQQPLAPFWKLLVRILQAGSSSG